MFAKSHNHFKFYPLFLCEKLYFNSKSHVKVNEVEKKSKVVIGQVILSVSWSLVLA